MARAIYTVALIFAGVSIAILVSFGSIHSPLSAPDKLVMVGIDTGIGIIAALIAIAVRVPR